MSASRSGIGPKCCRIWLWKRILRFWNQTRACSYTASCSSCRLLSSSLSSTYKERFISSFHSSLSVTRQTFKHILSSRSTLQSFCGEYHCGTYPNILQMLNVSSAVTILHASGQNPEALSTNSVYYWTSIREEMNAPDDQHAAIVYKPAGTQTLVL